MKKQQTTNKPLVFMIYRMPIASWTSLSLHDLNFITEKTETQKV